MPHSESDYQHIFSWKIEDFSLCVEKCGKYLSSPVFDAYCLGGCKWKMRIYPKDSEFNGDSYVSVYLINVDLDYENIDIDYKIEIVGDNQKVLKCEKYSSRFKRGEMLGWRNFFKVEKLNDYRESSSLDAITVICYLKKTGKVNTTSIEQIACTENHVDQFSVFWNVRNPNSPKWTENKKFHIPEGSVFDINLTCPVNDVVIHISRLSKPLPSTNFVKIEISLLDIEGISRMSATDSHFFDSKEHVWKFPSFINKTHLQNGILRNGMFTLFCKTYISHGKISETKSGVTQYVCPIINYSYGNLNSTLQDDFCNLFDKEKCSDVKIKCGKSIFFAHKLILAARSPVFSAMFDLDMMENQEGVVNITDLDDNTLKNFLKFIYTDTFDEIDYESALDLFIAGDKYEVMPLMERSSDYLINVMSVENVCDTLVIADMISYNHLKSCAIDYIKVHANEILDSSNWSLLIESHVELGVEVLHLISLHISKI